MPCDLEVSVDGEQTFLVDKEVVSSFCGRLRDLSDKAAIISSTAPHKVAIHGFPGGGEAFELMTESCCNKGRAQVTPCNACLLYYVARSMDMSDGVSASINNLLELTEKSLEGLPYWSWPEIMHALKQCQDLLPGSVSSGMLDRVLESVVGRITSVTDASPSGSSPESSALRFSVDTRSTISTKNGSRRNWWFEDFLSLSPDMIQEVIKSMVLQKVDHVLLSRFLMHYLKSSVSCASCNKKKAAAEVVIELLYSLDGGSSVSCKVLFEVLRVSASLKLSRGCQIQLESMIGKKFDHATLDNLLIPAPAGSECLYDVSLILRFLKFFLSTNKFTESKARLKQAAQLMDSYLAEVSPDSSLKPLMFLSLATDLPDEARDSHDAIYRAIDMYLEVHTQLLDEEKTKLFCAINYEKLSIESCKHLASNSKFPSRTVIRALISHQRKLGDLLRETNQLKKSSPEQNRGKKLEQFSDDQQIILYAKKLEISGENKRLKSHLQGMQWKVKELEKIFKKMQAQMEKAMKSRKVSPSGSKSLPRLCS